MRIDSSLPVTSPAVNASPESGSKVGTSKAAVGETSGIDTTSGFNPTADLARLVALVKEVPEMRAAVVQDVLERASAGELTSRTAAVDTAAALLETPNGG